MRSAKAEEDEVKDHAEDLLGLFKREVDVRFQKAKLRDYVFPRAPDYSLDTSSSDDNVERVYIAPAGTPRVTSTSSDVQLDDAIVFEGVTNVVRDR